MSYAGPDRSITIEAIRAAKKLKARRYRNRRLGDFLKELDLTEGRSTGIPTIQKSLRDNGSSLAEIDTNDERTYFLMTIPCREDMIGISNMSSLGNNELDKIFDQVSDQVKAIVTQCDISNKNGLFRLLGQISDKFLTKSKISDKHLHLVNLIIDLLCLLKGGSHSANYIVNTLKISSARLLRRNILSPLIETGYVAMTIPESPTSSKQEYLLTEQGYKLFENS